MKKGEIYRDEFCNEINQTQHNFCCVKSKQNGMGSETIDETKTHVAKQNVKILRCKN